jgi:hypothetical protein
VSSSVANREPRSGKGGVTYLGSWGGKISDAEALGSNPGPDRFLLLSKPAPGSPSSIPKKDLFSTKRFPLQLRLNLWHPHRTV